MKILWLSNNPCYAIEKLSPKTQSGGWLKALNYHIVNQDDIELSVCFYWPVALEPFEFHNTMYYPIVTSKPKSFFKKIGHKISGDNNQNAEIKKIYDIVNKVNPDLIHVHGTELNLGLIQYETSIPVVISIQGILSPYYEKYFSGIPEKYLKRVKKWNFMSLFKALNSAFKLNAERERHILKVAHYIMGRTDWDKRVTRLLAPKSTYFVGNEILRKAFYNTNHIWNKSNFDTPLKLVTTCGDVAYKGFELIVKTAKLLHDYGIEIEWYVIGLNEHNVTTKAVKSWLKHDLDHVGIKLLGVMNENELVKTLLESDIYCQVSHIENSPNSLCEAMMLGMPLVATNVGGTSSMMKSNVEGILVQEGEPYELAGAILELKNDFKKAKAYGLNGRKRALERHKPSKVVEEVITTYNTIIQKS
ncbi:glycosyltransferase family 4 protein [Psychroserpens mesophilus]|uniref:glycosyltransferase family 4 protein n=1 Tax=Psychroserpens mesophilus TaxID=325473 RepID=UPI0005917E5D|nr:glycosyltransferase family 4 protein [Psychroserpens mesophilus]